MAVEETLANEEATDASSDATESQAQQAANEKNLHSKGSR